MTNDIPILASAGPQAPPADLAPAVQAAMTRLGRVKSLTILVNDPQRHTDTRAVLEVLRELTDLGQSRILVATGTHSFPIEEQREFRRRLTAGLLRGRPGGLPAAGPGGLPVAGFGWHDCHRDDLVAIGAAGKPGLWRGHPWLLEADGVLSIGSVEPHYFAGFTGAHKTATIGCAAYGDIEANHAWAMHPSCRPCQIEGNPIFLRVRGFLEAMEQAQNVAAVQVVQAGAGLDPGAPPSPHGSPPPSSGRIGEPPLSGRAEEPPPPGRLLAACGGKVMDSLLAAIPPATRTFCRHIPRPADAIIAEVSGPLGVSFYQADKGIKNNEWAVRDGGALILSAPCPRGIGQDHFMHLLREAAGYDHAVEIVNRRGYRLGDHKAVRLRYLTDARHRGVRLFLVSEGISTEDAAALGAAKAASVQQALELSGLRPGRDAIYRVRDAGNVCVLVEGRGA